MVKRRKEEETAGVLEFKGMTSEDSNFTAWLAEHKAAKRGKMRIAQGGTGVRVMFSDASDMAMWSARAEQAGRGKKVGGS